MRLHYLQHVPFEGLGYIETWAQKQNFSISATRLYETMDFPNTNTIDCLIVMGGPMSANDTSLFPWLGVEKEFIRNAIDANKPVLGICLGAQLIANVLGSNVYKGVEKEIGWFPVEKTPHPPDGIGKVFPEKVDVFHWHGETFDLPEGCVHLARSDACKNQAFMYRDRVIGLQFHLESTPESVKDLIRHCSDEIVDAPYIQPAEAMLENNDRFHTIHTVMDNLLKYQMARR